MLDLKKLEKNLDKALASETKETLTSWLQEKRLRTFMQSLGEGTFTGNSTTNFNIFLKKPNNCIEIPFIEIIYLQDYQFAA